jgi:hypothetical protein
MENAMDVRDFLNLFVILVVAAAAIMHIVCCPTYSTCCETSISSAEERVCCMLRYLVCGAIPNYRNNRRMGMETFACASKEF